MCLDVRWKTFVKLLSFPEQDKAVLTSISLALKLFVCRFSSKMIRDVQLFVKSQKSVPGTVD